MTKKVRKLLIGAVSALFALAIALFAVACTEPVKYTLRFLDGGTEITSVEAKAGANITDDLPSDPTRSGLEFAGWSTTEGGEPEELPTKMPKADATYYAQWNATLTVTGSGTPVRYQVRVGTNLATFLADKVPQAANGLEFAGWYSGNAELAADAIMPNTAMTLTARFLANYTVEIYWQNADGSYPETPETKPGKALAGDPFDTEQFAVDHFETDGDFLGDHNYSGALQGGEVFTVHFARKIYTVTYRVNAPEGGVGERDTVLLYKRYGEALELPAEDVFGLSFLYMFVGWDLDGKFFEPGDTIAAVEGNATLDAQWAAPRTDYFGSSDTVIVWRNEAFLYRRGLTAEGEFKTGTYNPETHIFSFAENEKEILGGRIVGEGKFYYFRDEQQRIFPSFDGSEATLEIKAHGTAVYKPNAASEGLAGTYDMDAASGRYVFTSGETVVEFVLDEGAYGALTFRTENTEETGYYALVTDIQTGDFGYKIFYLDGFGFLTEYYSTSDPLYAYFHGSVGRYYHLTAWGEDNRFYTVYFDNGDGYSFMLEGLGYTASYDGYRLKGVWYGYDGVVGDYSVSAMVDADLSLDGFGHATWLGEQYNYALQEDGFYMAYVNEYYYLDYYLNSTYYIELYTESETVLMYLNLSAYPLTYTIMERTPYFEDFATNINEYVEGDYFDFYGASFYHMLGDNEAVYLLGWTYMTVQGGYIILHDIIGAGTITLVDEEEGLWHFEDLYEVFSFDFIYRDGLVVIRIKPEDEGATDFVVYEDENEKFWIDVYNEAYYTDANGVTTLVTAYIDNLVGSDDEGGFFRFILEDGTERIFRFTRDSQGVVMLGEIDSSYFFDIEMLDYYRGSGLITSVRLFVDDDHTVYFGVQIYSQLYGNYSYAFYRGTNTAISGSADEYNFTVDAEYLDTLEYFGVRTTSFRYKLGEGVFWIYDEAFDIAGSLGTFWADGYGNARIVMGDYDLSGTYALLVRYEDGSFLVQYTDEDTSILVLSIDKDKSDFILGGDHTGVYYLMDSYGNSYTNDMAFVFDGPYFSESETGKVTAIFEGEYFYGNYTYLYTIPAEENFIGDGKIPLDVYDIVLYTPGENGGTVATHWSVAATLLSVTGYADHAITIGAFFLTEPAYAGEFETTDGGSLFSAGFITYYDEDLITYAHYTLADGTVINGLFIRGNMVEDSFYVDDFFFEPDENGNQILFILYDDYGEASEQYIFDLVRRGDKLVADRRTTTYGMYAEVEGTLLTGATLYFDGHGAAIYTDADGVAHAGTFTESPIGGEGAFVFKANDDSVEPIIFQLFTIGGTYFGYYVYTAEEDSVFVADDWSLLILDGYMNGQYVDHYGVVTEGTFLFLNDTVVRFITGTDVYYFRLSGDSFSFIDTEFIVDDDGVLLAYQGDPVIYGLTIPDEVTRIATTAFEMVVEINDYIDFANVRIVDDFAFTTMDLYLTAIRSELIEWVGDWAFAATYNQIYHWSIMEVYLPNATHIGEFAFYLDSAIGRITLGKIEYIGEFAFAMQYNYHAYEGGVVIDLTRVEDIGKVDLHPLAFQGLDRSVPIYEYLDESQQEIIPVYIYALAYVKDLETLREFRVNEKWPKSIRDRSIVEGQFGALQNTNFYSFYGDSYLRFDNEGIFYTATKADPDDMYADVVPVGLYQMDGDQVKIYAFDDLNYTTPIETFEATYYRITYKDAVYFRGADMMSEEPATHVVDVDNAGYSLSFRLIIEHAADGYFAGWRINGVAIDGEMMSVMVTDLEEDLTATFTANGEKGSYTVHLDFSQYDGSAEGWVKEGQRWLRLRTPGDLVMDQSFIADFGLNAAGEVESLLLLQVYTGYGSTRYWAEVTDIQTTENPYEWIATRVYGMDTYKYYVTFIPAAEGKDASFTVGRQSSSDRTYDGGTMPETPQGPVYLAKVVVHTAADGTVTYELIEFMYGEYVNPLVGYAYLPLTFSAEETASGTFTVTADGKTFTVTVSAVEDEYDPYVVTVVEVKE